MERVRFWTIHDKWVEGYFIYPADTTAQALLPAIILLHGNHTPGKEGLKDLALMLARTGRTVLLYDADGYGERFVPGRTQSWDQLGPFAIRDRAIQA